MWILVKIQGTNIAAFKEFEYSLTPGVTTLVFGNNMDNDSQGSNGSGKSALLEAISIATTGETLRKVKADEIINDGADEARVIATYHNVMFGEDFVVSRIFSRKDPQQISCHIYKDGNEVNVEETKQSGVSEYNKYILDKIGLTKDDIFNNYILSKHKFHCFLSSSDKDKKDIINRFSNAVIVDDAISELEKDLIPVRQKMTVAELDVSKLDGSMSAIEDQILQAKDNVINEKNNKVTRKQELESAINIQKENIKSANASIRECESRISSLDDIYDQVAELEKDESLSLNQCYHSILEIFSKNSVVGFENWEEKSRELSEQLKNEQRKQIELSQQADAAYKKTDAAQKELDKLRVKYSSFETANHKQLETLKSGLNSIKENVSIAEHELSNIQKQQNTVKTQIVSLQNKIAGTIICPKCSHSFVLDSDVDIDATKKEIEKLNKEEVSLNSKSSLKENEIEQFSLNKKENSSKQRALSDELELEAEKLRKHSLEVNSLFNTHQFLKRETDKINGKVDNIENAINDMFNDMFDSAFEIVDNLTKNEKGSVQQHNITISTCNGATSTFQQSIKDLDAIDDNSLISQLESNLKEYEKKHTEAVDVKQKIESEVHKLVEQEQRFVEFKTHLANTKIDALSLMTNEFLERIGSDIRIRFSGFTVLKSGKVRDKISISLIRNGIDCGSFDKFSEGEKARVNLANILAMNKLTNVNCEEGKGLDLLVLDEILEATDESGLANIFEALNSLQITSLVVSHGNVAENYPHRLVVNKKNGVSFINEN